MDSITCNINGCNINMSNFPTEKWPEILGFLRKFTFTVDQFEDNDDESTIVHTDDEEDEKKMQNFQLNSPIPFQCVDRVKSSLGERGTV